VIEKRNKSRSSDHRDLENNVIINQPGDGQEVDSFAATAKNRSNERFKERGWGMEKRGERKIEIFITF
jgi:hypothetical protein